MSVWGDIRRRAEGKQKRQENKFLNEKEIRAILESYVVGENAEPPFIQFAVLAMNEDVKLYFIVLTAVEHPGQKRNFYSESNVLKIMDIGGVLKLESLNVHDPAKLIREYECLG